MHRERILSHFVILILSWVITYKKTIYPILSIRKTHFFFLKQHYIFPFIFVFNPHTPAQSKKLAFYIPHTLITPVFRICSLIPFKGVFFWNLF